MGLPSSRYVYLMKNGTAMPIRASDSVSAIQMLPGIFSHDRLILHTARVTNLNPPVSLDSLCG